MATKKPAKPKLKAVPKAKQPPMPMRILRGGPWDGTYNGIPNTTLVFRLGNFHGCYVSGEWEDVQVN